MVSAFFFFCWAAFLSVLNSGQCCSGTSIVENKPWALSQSYIVWRGTTISVCCGNANGIEECLPCLSRFCWESGQWQCSWIEHREHHYCAVCVGCLSGFVDGWAKWGWNIYGSASNVSHCFRLSLLDTLYIYIYIWIWNCWIGKSVLIRKSFWYIFKAFKL